MSSGRIFTWQSPSGDTLQLSDRNNGYYVIRGVTGLGKPQYVIDIQDRADGDGGSLRKVRATTRSIFLPVHVQGSSRDDYLDKKQYLSSMMDPSDGAGYLIIQDGSRLVRTRAIYESGMEGDESRGIEGDLGDDGYWGKTGIVLRCFLPYFEMVNPVIFQYDGNDPGRNFFPLFPLTVQSSQALSAAPIRIDNPGTKDSWGVWTFTGPFSTVVLTNITTGQTIQINRSLVAGETMTIDMANFLIYKDSGENLYPYLIQDNFWPFVKGVNMIQLSVVGVTSASSIVGSFRPRLESLV